MFFQRKHIDGITFILIGIAAFLLLLLTVTVFVVLQKQSGRLTDIYSQGQFGDPEMTNESRDVTHEYRKALVGLRDDMATSEDPVRVAQERLLAMRVPADMTEHHLQVFLSIQSLKDTVYDAAYLKREVISGIDTLLQFIQ